jgi:hypothetical protein
MDESEKCAEWKQQGKNIQEHIKAK